MEFGPHRFRVWYFVVIISILIGFSLAYGLCSALDTLISQAYGAKAYRLTGLYAQRAAVILTLSSIPVAALWWERYSGSWTIKRNNLIQPKYIIRLKFGYSFLFLYVFMLIILFDSSFSLLFSPSYCLLISQFSAILLSTFFLLFSRGSSLSSWLFCLFLYHLFLFPLYSSSYSSTSSTSFFFHQVPDTSNSWIWSSYTTWNCHHRRVMGTHSHSWYVLHHY